MYNSSAVLRRLVWVVSVLLGASFLSVCISGCGLGVTCVSSSLCTASGSTPGTIKFAASAFTVNENGQSIAISVLRTDGAIGAITVHYTTADASATAGIDYGAVSGNLSWADGDTSSKSIAVPILDPGATGGNSRNFTITLTSPTGGASLGTPNEALISINDNDSAKQTLQFSSSSLSTSEGSGLVALSVTRLGGTSGSVAVNFTSVNGTALSGADYSAVNGTLSWADGDGSARQIKVPILDPGLVSGSKTFSVSISGVAGGASLGVPATTTVTIDDNDVSLQTVQLSAGTYLTSESAGSIALAVTRTGLPSGAVSVAYATLNGTAASGTDYVAAIGTLSWADGDSSTRTITVPILDPKVTSGSKNFSLTLNSATGAAALGSPASAVITIQDNDASAGTIQLSASSYSTSESAGNVVLSVSRTGATNGSVSVNYMTVNGTAVAGTDFTAVSGTLTWTDGESNTKVVVVPIIDSQLTSGSKTFSFDLSLATGGAALGSPSTSTITISDNDVLHGVIQLSASTYTASESAGNVTLAVTRTGGNNGPVSVSYATSDNTALSGIDYSTQTGTLSWSDGDSSNKLIVVPLLDRKLTQGSERFTVALGSATGGAVLGNPSNASVTIDDTDVVPGVIQLSASAYSTSESASSIVLTVNRTGGTSGLVSVTFTTFNGSAISGTDYTAQTGTLNWASGDNSSKTISIPILDRGLASGSVVFNLVLSSPEGGASLGSPSTSVVTINDNDVLPGVIQLSSSTYSTSESAGSLVLTVNRTGGNGGAVSISFASVNGSAISGTDYTEETGTLAWTAGDNSSKTITIPILDQGLTSGSKAFNVVLNSATGNATLGSPSASVVTINDNDIVPGVIQLSSSTYSTSESAGSVALTVNRTGGTSGMVSVSFATLNGSAIDGTDYTAETGTLSWAQGDSSAKTITIPILDQGVTSGSKTFNLVVSSPSGGATLGSPSTGIVTINDNDSTSGVIELAASSYSTDETSGSIVIPVARTGGSTGAVSVSFSTADGSALSGTDFTKTAGVLTWASGSDVAQTITIPIANSGSTGGSKNFQVVLSSPTGGATLGSPNSTVISINQNDTHQQSIQFASSSYPTTESFESVVLAVSRVGSSAGAVSATYSTSDGTATAGVGYTPETGVLSWADGDTNTKAITIPILDAKLTTGTQSFNVILVSATNGAAVGSPSTAVVSIKDNDVAPQTSILEFSGAQVYTYEGANAQVTVTRTGGSAGPISVSYATSNATAVAGTDYTEAKGTLTWAANDSSSRTIAIPILEGQTYTGSRGFSVNLGGVVGDATLGAPTSSLVTIGAAGTVQFSSNTFATSEGSGGIQLTVTRTAGSNDAISVTYTTHDGTALAGTDYSSVSSTLVWNSTDGSAKTIIVPILNPNVNGSSRTFTVTLSAVTGGASLGSVSSAAVTISDDLSGAGTLQFTQRSFVTQENSRSVALNVSRISGTKGQVAAGYLTFDGTGEAGTDYSQSSGMLIWGDGEAGTKQINIPIMDLDHWDGGTRVFSVVLSNPTNGAALGTPATAIVNIAENDKSAGSITLLSPSYTLTESSGSLDVTVQRINGYNGSVSVVYATADETAVAPGEYGAQSGTFTWADGDTTSRTITVPIVDAKISGGSHTFILTVSSPTGGAVIGTNPKTTVTIADTDATENACPTLPAISLGVGEDGAGGSNLTGNTAPIYPACSSNFQLYGTTVSAGGITSEGGNDFFYGQYDGTAPVQYNINIPASSNLSTLFDNRLGYSQGYTIVMESKGNTPNYEVIAVPSANFMNNGWLNTYPLTYQTQSYTTDATQTVVLLAESQPSSQIINNGTIGDFYVASNGAYTIPQNPANPNQQNYTTEEITTGALFINNGIVTNTAKGYLGSANSIFTSGSGTIYNYGAIAGQNDGILSAFTSYNFDNGGLGLSNLGFASIHAYNNVYNYGYILGQDYGVLLEGNNTVINTYGGLPVPGVTDFLGRQVFNGQISCQVFPSHRTVNDPNRRSVNPIMMDGNGETLNLISRTINGAMYLPVIVSEMDGGFNGNFSNSKANVLNTLNFNFTGLSVSDYRSLIEAINQSEQQNAMGTFYTGSASIQGISYNWSGFAYVNFTGIPPE